MTNKAVVCVSGISDGTTLLNVTTMNKDHKFFPKNGWWLWCINPANVLNLCARTLGAPADRNDAYFEFTSKLRSLANEYFDFDNAYVDEMVQRFSADDRVDLLYIYGIGEEKTKFLQEDVGSFSLMVSSTKSNKDFSSQYDKVLKWDDPDFTDNVVEFLNILTEEKEKIEE